MPEFRQQGGFKHTTLGDFFWNKKTAISYVAKKSIKNTSRNLVFFGHHNLKKLLQVPFFLEQKKGLQKSHEITYSHYSSIRKDFKAVFSKSWDCHCTKCLMNDHIFALFNPPLILIVQVFLGVGGDILSNLLLQSSG